jgi:hypothetical protein
METAGGAAACAVALPVAEGTMARRLPALLAALLAGGCAAFGDAMGRESALEDAQLRYTQYVRWGELAAASEFVAPDERAEFLGQARAFEGIRVTDYEIGRIVYDEDRESATVRVTYRAYSLGSLEERRVEEEQRWVRPGAGNTWYVHPQLAGLIGSLPGSGR